MSIEGRVIGSRYEILEKIGNGGMATVYRAMDKVLKRYVAVKILRDEYITDEEFVKRFECEAQSAAKLSHHNIVSIFDVGVDDNLHYIVMELVKGNTLKELIIQERGPLPWKWSINVAIQIASALEMAHKNNIVHRDIKPHNIIITEDGIAKVTDFGIAKAVSNSTITAFGTTIGSVHYFSPEHARGGYTDAKSDIYSLGVVMYEMLTGKVPFDADTPVSVALKHMQEEPVPPIEVNPAISEPINKLILKALQKDVNLRYQSAAEILSDLKRVLKNPNETIVGEMSYDPTARTQVIGNLDEDEEEYKMRDRNKRENKSGNKFIGFIKKHKILSTFLGLIILFGISLGATIGLLGANNPEELQLPNFAGMTKAEVEAKAEELNLEIEFLEEVYNKDVEEGKVISQDPIFRENFNIKEESVVKILISKGQEKTVVPKVIGEQKEEATRLLEEANLLVEIEEIVSETVEKNVVISQSIKENEEIFAGETVKLQVSIGTGLKEIPVPSVVGKTEEEGRTTLEDALLRVEVVYEENNDKNNGEILKQSIDVGQIAEEGTTIVITVNKIQELIEGTVKVNLKSVLNYTAPESSTEEENTESGSSNQTTVEQVQVRIVAGEETIYNQKNDKDTTNISATFSGKGNVTIKLYVDDVLKGTKQLNLNSATSVTFE